MENSPPLSTADKTISMSNSPHPFSSILKGGRVNAECGSARVSLCMAPMWPLGREARDWYTNFGADACRKTDAVCTEPC